MDVSTMKNEIKIDLGIDVNSLGISDTSIELKIEEALRKVGAYTPFVESASFTVTDSRVVLPPNTVSVAKVLTPKTIRNHGATLYQDDTDLFSVNRYLYNYNELSDPFLFLMQRNQLNTLQSFISISDWRYDKSQNTLYLHNYDSQTISIVYLRKYSDLSEVQEDEVLQTIKEYALALCKIVEGTIRRKLQSAPGAIQMDGDALVSEGNAEKQRLDEWIPRQYSYLRFGIRI